MTLASISASVGGAVLRRVALAEHVEVDAVQDEDLHRDAASARLRVAVAHGRERIVQLPDRSLDQFDRRCMIG